MTFFWLCTFLKSRSLCFLTQLEQRTMGFLAVWLKSPFLKVSNVVSKDICCKGWYAITRGFSWWTWKSNKLGIKQKKRDSVQTVKSVSGKFGKEQDSQTIMRSHKAGHNMLPGWRLVPQICIPGPGEPQVLLVFVVTLHFNQLEQPIAQLTPPGHLGLNWVPILGENNKPAELMAVQNQGCRPLA